ncbi:hypothetical protein RYX36_007720, partial [Vicia faba]
HMTTMLLPFVGIEVESFLLMSVKIMHESGQMENASNIELWSPTESSRTMSVMAHKWLIVGLADSLEDELAVSVGHDCLVKIWR